jgi:hypothetical protein
LLNFQGKRIIKNYTMKIEANPESVFPLLCPEREKEWIDGWAYEMIYSKSGFAELNCVWKSNFPNLGEAYWIMTRCVSPKEAEYVRFIPDLMIVNLLMELKEQDNDTTLIEVTNTFTGLCKQGNLAVDQVSQVVNNTFSSLETSLNHFVSTGCLLKNLK